MFVQQPFTAMIKSQRDCRVTMQCRFTLQLYHQALEKRGEFCIFYQQNDKVSTCARCFCLHFVQ